MGIERRSRLPFKPACKIKNSFASMFPS